MKILNLLNLLKHICFLPFKLLTILLLLFLLIIKQMFINPYDVIIIPQQLINFLMKNLLKK